MAVIDKTYLQGAGDKYKESGSAIRRQNPFSLEYYDIFYSYEEAKDYAENNPLSYVGQRISVVSTLEDGSIDSILYIINDRTGALKEVGIGCNIAPEVIDRSDKILSFTDGVISSSLGIEKKGRDINLIGKDGSEVISGITTDATYPESIDFNTETECFDFIWKITNEDGEEVEVTYNVPFIMAGGDPGWTLSDSDTISFTVTEAEDSGIKNLVANLKIKPSTDTFVNAIKYTHEGAYVELDNDSITLNESGQLKVNRIDGGIIE